MQCESTYHLSRKISCRCLTDSSQIHPCAAAALLCRTAVPHRNWCQITPNAKLRDSSIYLDSYQKHEKLNRGRSWQEAGRRLHRHLVESSVHAHPDPILRPKSTEAAAAVASAASFWADSFLQLNVSHLGSLPPTYSRGCWSLEIGRSRWWASLIADLPFEMHFCK